MAETDRRELFPGKRKGVAAAGQLQRHGDILDRGHGLDQVEGLEDDADGAAPEPRQRILAELGEIATRHDYPAAARLLEPRDHHQQGRLARARRSDDADALALLHSKIDAAEDVDLARGTRQL